MLSTWLNNTLMIGGAFVAFAAIHSLVAGIRPKTILKRFLPERVVEGWYRLVYNLFSFVTVAPVLVLIAVLPNPVVYLVPAPWSILMFVFQVLGFVGLAGALFVTDVLHFAGLKQFYAFITNKPFPAQDPPMQVTGMYHYTRHPLYFFSLLAIWFLPLMTLNHLIFNMFSTVYFVVGSLIEEGRLERIYGQQYRDYKRRVSWLIPFPSRRLPGSPPGG
ncbi:MAG: isoprenylcysteine carboxylmethyltransferase family protein [Anaerolineae bacterium]|nr:isoprenylcysteine carboxylmethyltransferase family protein [Anaerolineae bacterium]